jgi:hypothetical protein
MGARITVEKFGNMPEVKLMLSKATEMGGFTIRILQGAVKELLLITQPEAMAKLGMRKPDGTDPDAMFDEEVFQSGKEALPAGDHPLLVEVMDQHHVFSCALCKAADCVDERCRWAKKRLCIKNGWWPPVAPEKIKQQYPVEGNYKGVEEFSESASKEFEKMKASGTAREVEVPAGFKPSYMGIVSPLGAQVKSSDVARALAVCGEHVKGQAALSAANAKFKAMEMPQIKVRLTHDVAATGLNAASPTKPFVMPQLWRALALVSKDCWMAKGDVSRFYYSFPIALGARWMFMCIFLGVLYEIVRCTFGYKLCPYYCSAFSAEFGRWMAAYGIPVAWMMDDWLTVGKTKEEARANLMALKGIMESVGFKMEAEKDGLEQKLVFLGILINSITMRLSFEPVVAKAFHKELLTYVRQLEAGGHWDDRTCKRIAGKCEWLSQVLVEGRLYIDAFYHYAYHGRDLSAHGRSQVLLYSAFWLAKLDNWANGVQTTEFPILSAGELKSNPDKVHFIQGDASGEDGQGYYHGSLADEDYEFVATAWKGDEWDFETSHAGELKTPLHFLRHTELRDVVVVVILDCLSAVWSINKGRCYERVGRVVLAEILRLCDEKGIQLVGLWVPRERNECADFLSHLAALLNRDEVSGRLSDITGPAEVREECRG